MYQMAHKGPAIAFFLKVQFVPPVPGNETVLALEAPLQNYTPSDMDAMLQSVHAVFGQTGRTVHTLQLINYDAYRQFCESHQSGYQ